MPREQVVVKREILPDPKYNSKLLAKFVNVLMRKGKKSTAEAIAYKALDRIKDKTSGDPIAIFKKAIDNLKPSLEEKSMVEKLAGEILDASNNTGLAIKKKDDVHRMAEANKAFAHYRW